jgi:3-dehydroquinate synthase
MQVEPTLVAVPGEESADYPVFVGKDLVGQLPRLLRQHAPAHRFAIISDEQVAAIHGARVMDLLLDGGISAHLFSFQAGEQQKTRESWSRLSDQMLQLGFGRDCAVIALGGGVTGDLAGFVAATYMRGLPLVQIPTSLLAMIDSAVGGKTGVDTPAGKNLIGAFHPPRLVLVETGFLGTLPEAHLRSGMAEAVKHGAIADAHYFDEISANSQQLLTGDEAALTRLVLKSVEIKAGVVARDPHESGVRKILNFGHTLGHAVEALSGYRLLHGEAVSIGMVLEARLGEKVGITAAGTAERLRDVLSGLQLSVRVPTGMDADEILAATRLDKKAREGRVEYSLIEAIGRAAPSTAVPAERVLEVLRDAD